MAIDTFQRFNDFERKYEKQFLAKSAGHKYFFRTFTDVQSQNETQKTAKNRLFKF